MSRRARTSLTLGPIRSFALLSSSRLQARQERAGRPAAGRLRAEDDQAIVVADDGGADGGGALVLRRPLARRRVIAPGRQRESVRGGPAGVDRERAGGQAARADLDGAVEPAGGQ